MASAAQALTIRFDKAVGPGFEVTDSQFGSNIFDVNQSGFGNGATDSFLNIDGTTGDVVWQTPFSLPHPFAISPTDAHHQSIFYLETQGSHAGQAAAAPFTDGTLGSARTYFALPMGVSLNFAFGNVIPGDGQNVIVIFGGSGSNLYVGAFTQVGNSFTANCGPNGFVTLPSTFDPQAATVLGNQIFLGGTENMLLGFMSMSPDCLKFGPFVQPPLPDEIAGSENLFSTLAPFSNQLFIDGGFERNQSAPSYSGFAGLFNPVTGTWATGFPYVSSPFPNSYYTGFGVFSNNVIFAGAEQPHNQNSLTPVLHLVDPTTAMPGPGDGLAWSPLQGNRSSSPQALFVINPSLIDVTSAEYDGTSLRLVILGINPSASGGGGGGGGGGSGGGGGAGGTGGTGGLAKAFDFGNAPWDHLRTGYDPGRARTAVFPSANSLCCGPDNPSPILPQDRYAPYATVHGGVFLGTSEDGELNAKQLEQDNDGVAIGPSAPVCAIVVHHGFHKRVRHYTRPLTVTVTLDGVAPPGGKTTYFNFWADLNHAGDWNGGTQCHGFVPDHQLVNLPLVIPGGQRSHTFKLFYREGFDTSPYWTRSIITLKPLPPSPRGAEGGENINGQPPGFIGAGEIEDWLSPPVAPAKGQAAPPRPPVRGGGRPPCSGDASLGTIFYPHIISPGSFTAVLLPCNIRDANKFDLPQNKPFKVLLCYSVDFYDFALNQQTHRYYNWTGASPRCVSPRFTVANGTELDFNGSIPPGQWFAIVSTPLGDFIAANTIIVR